MVLHAAPYALEETQLQDFANQLYDKARTWGVDALLLVHLLDDKIYDPTNVHTPIKQVYLPQWQLIDPNGIVENEPIDAGSFQDFLLGYYRGIRKPYYSVIYKDLPASDFATEVYIEDDWITGYDAIYNYWIWDYHQQEPKITGYIESVPIYDKTIQQLKNQAQQNIDDPDHFEITRQYNLKEDCIFSYFEQYGSQTAQSEFFNFLTGNYVHDNCVYQQTDLVDAIVYPTIDFLSFVPILGVIPDLVGLSISGYRGDLLRFSEYAAGSVLHFQLGGQLIEASLQQAIRRAILSINQKALIDLETASTTRLATLLREYCQISSDQATTFATRLKDEIDKADHVCTPSAYQYLESEAAKGNFDEALEVLFKGAQELDDLIAQLRLRFENIPGINPDRIDDLARETVQGLDGYPSTVLSDEALQLIGTSDHGLSILQSIRGWNNEAKFGTFTDDLKVDLFRDWIGAGAGRVNTWEVVRNLGDHVRLNPAILKKLDDLLAGGNIPPVKFENALNKQFGEVLDAGNNVQVNKILDRLKETHVNEKHFDELIARLENPNYQSTLVIDLKSNPDWFETFEDIIHHPGKYWDIIEDASTPNSAALASWGQGHWWKNLREKAKVFESYDPLRPNSTGIALKEFARIHKILPENSATQITIVVNGKRTRIDYMTRGDDGMLHFGEAKFSTKQKIWSVDWKKATTKNQSEAFPEIISKNFDLEIRASDPDKIRIIEQNLGIAKNADGKYIIPIDEIGTFKIFGSSADDANSISEVIDLIK